MVYMVNSFSFQDTDVAFSLNTNNKFKNSKSGAAGEKNVDDSTYLRQIKKVFALCMEILYIVQEGITS